MAGLIDRMRGTLGFETPESRAEKDAALIKKNQETGAAVTPGLVGKQENAEQSKKNLEAGAIQGKGRVVWPGKPAASAPVEADTSKRRGGLVKAKPRGVGIARKGHGRAQHG